MAKKVIKNAKVPLINILCMPDVLNILSLIQK
jgi:hypothetical protein